MTDGYFSKSFPGPHTGCSLRKHNNPLLDASDNAARQGKASAQVTDGCDVIGGRARLQPCRKRSVELWALALVADSVRSVAKAIGREGPVSPG
jgi:hypothetical protein